MEVCAVLSACVLMCILGVGLWCMICFDVFEPFMFLNVFIIVTMPLVHTVIQKKVTTLLSQNYYP